ncbi:MAG: protein-L-isoaspartate O-methyltransferase [Desulfuromonas sp.]|nr:MAG: protein-L-isoaspartate O-methyltransferase [Desulfuromonas sp.]
MDFTIARRRMVETQIVARGVDDQRVIDAMLKVPRHLFVDEALWGHAYADGSLPIGEKQTISQPFMVAAMTSALHLKGDERVLEIGAGSGYQTAVLAQLARRIYSIERISSLASRARRILDKCRATNVNLKIGDGTIGWKEQAPFDAILVAAGAPEVPRDYLEQLEIGGTLVMPVGGRDSQELIRVVRTAEDDFDEQRLMSCRFVPLIGEQGWNSDCEEG